MVIRRFRKLNFDQLLSLHGLLETFLGKQVEWFTDEASNIIGTVAGAEADGGWNLAVLRRDRRGYFRMCHLKRNLYTLRTATIDLRRSMAKAENSKC
jgi:hypothetical protein